MNVRRAALHDVFVEDGRAAVFVHDQVIVLSEIATAILEATPSAGSTSLDALTEAVVRIYGPPEPPLTARDATERQIQDLVAHHVLAVDSAEAHEPFTPESVGALRDALRHLLSHDEQSWSLPAGVSGPQFLEAAERHRVVPTLTSFADRLALPAATAAQLAASTRQESATVDVLGAELAEIVGSLEAAEVRVLAFKGLALAVLAHGRVDARGTGDHDLLVAPGDLDRAYVVLTSLGWTPVGAFPRPGDSWAWRSFLSTYYELSLGRGSSMIDLHWHVGPVRDAFPPFDELWGRHVRVRIGGREVATLSAYDALAHSASHSAKDHWRWLRGLLDVWLLMSQPDTWHGADRPLRPDQLMSVALAARMFGTPAAAPDIVHHAAQMAAEVWSSAVDRQAGPSHIEATTRMPGLGFIRAAIALRRADGKVSDFARQLSLSLIPPTTAADIPARSGFVAVPLVLGRRITEVTTLWRRAAGRALARRNGQGD